MKKDPLHSRERLPLSHLSFSGSGRPVLMAVARPCVMYWKVFSTPRSTSRLGNLRPKPGPEEQSGLLGAVPRGLPWPGYVMFPGRHFNAGFVCSCSRTRTLNKREASGARHSSTLPDKPLPRQTQTVAGLFQSPFFLFQSISSNVFLPKQK